MKQARCTRAHLALALSLVAAAPVLLWALPGKAGAAVQLGQVSPGDPPSSCAAGNFLQATTSATTNPYEVPSPGGVITRWSHRGNETDAASGRLQVWRAASPSNFTLVGRSTREDFTAGVVESFPTRIRVSAEDVLGLRNSVNTGCIHDGVLGDRVFRGFPSSDPAPGETWNFPAIDNTFLLNVSAVLEPDADADGFGDETQDRCPGQPGPNNGCPPEPSPPPSQQLELELDAKNKQQAKKLQVDVACGAVDCSVDFAGKGKVPKASEAAVAAAKAKKFTLKPKSVEVAAGATETVRLKFKKNKKSVKKVKRMLKQGGKKIRKRAKAVVKATATGAGGTDSAKQKIKLR